MAFIRTTASILTCLLLLFTHYLFAQPKMTNYDKRWKTVDSLSEKKGLTQSALEEISKIYTLAKKEKNDAQLIKALTYQASLQRSIQEDSDDKTIAQWQQEINTASEPAKSILESILAEKYYTYFQQNSIEIYGRTQTVNFKKDDFTTWGKEDFHKRVTAGYLASLKDEKLLQQTKLEPFDAIIIKGNARMLRPTVYDLLAHRALDYFKTSGRNITNPAYAFEIKDDRYLNPAAAFVQLSITTKDSASLYHKALLIYQKLLAFHLNDTKPDALIDADLDRIEFVYQHGVMENKDALYEKALNNIAEKYGNTPAAAQAHYLVAQLHANKAAQYKPLQFDEKDPNNPKNEYVVAAAICKKILEQKDESEGKTNCYNLLKQIERREINLSTEKVNLPQQPFRTLVQYRNFSTLYFRIITLTADQAKKLQNRYDNSYWNDLVALQPLRAWNQPLPVINDYQQHSAEVKIDALPVGAYILLASANADFSPDKNPLAVQYFYVSGISYINNSNEYFILNRESGKPLAGAVMQTWWTQYDYNSRSNKKVKGEKYTADKNGYLSITKNVPNRQGNVQLEITSDKDKLFMDDGPYMYYRQELDNADATDAATYERNNARIYLFTDRSIYRPGQAVYFKGIAITKDFITRKSKVLGGKQSKIFLRNANGDEIDSLELKTNEYGSYSGKFVLPQGTLNGMFNLMDENITLVGNNSFSVEEYKRPKFFVEYEKTKGSYKVNDSITVTGFAKAYAGNNIDGAQVKYRVQRVARFIYPWLYWKWGVPRGSNMEITNGVATTDADGKFKIVFKAIPDLTVNRSFDPIFDYRITTDITDINGETRSAETTVPVSYKALQLSIGLPLGETIPVDSLKNILISTKNMSGEFEPAQVKVSINKLQSPDRLIRKRYWAQPDQFVMGREEFIKYFPNDEYQDELNHQSWPKEKTYFTGTDSSQVNSKFKIQNSKFAEGWYSIEVTTKDKYGAEVKDIKYVQLYDEKSKALPAPAYTWSTQKHGSIEPGETSTITIGSSASDIFLIQEIEKMGDDTKYNADKQKNITYSFTSLSNEKKPFDFPGTEADRGGFGVYHFFVKNNRFYSLSSHVDVPWTNKELQISYETFRDKTLPGSEEKWKLKISGYKKEKLAAEMMASLYDASLDQFKPHSWTVPDVWATYFGTTNWTGGFCFNPVQSQEKYWNEETKSFVKTYDYLNSMSNGIYFGGDVRNLSIRGNASFQHDMNPDVRYKSSMAPVALENASLDRTVVVGYGTKKIAADTVSYITSVYTKQEEMFVHAEQIKKPGYPTDNIPVQIRKNFNETAFFFPDLKTDTAGNISFGFTIPEALTKWKFQALAHTKDLAFGYSMNNVVTQKPLMVQPNAPRFLREGDKLELSAKVVNLTDKEVTGTVQLDLTNAATNQPVDGWFHNMYPTQYFTAAANQSTVVKFSLEIPYQYNSAVIYRFTAKGAESSDGEEAALPVLSNSMLVTESMPLPMRGNSAKNFRFEKLLQSGGSETLQQHALTVEFTTNPAWYAVQALPYLMEYPYDCAEQTFNRYYANAIATKIANASPKLKEIFEKWKASDTSALLSNLQKNQELKAVLLEETPWVMETKNEAQQKKNIALLFDVMKMSQELSASLEKLKQLQTENGGFVWFKGGRDDRYMTQYIITGIGHIKKLGALSIAQQKEWAPIISAAVKYLDQRIKEDYDNLVKYKTDLSKNNLGYIEVQYLYMRSFFSEYAVPGASFSAVNYFRKQSQQYWLQQNKYMQGMIALSLFRSGDPKTAGDILKSLKQNAIVNEEMGMYWKENTAGYYWHQAPVETQSLLIEAFAEINKDNKTVEDLKTWLLKQKQTQNWKTTKATADACYALLLQGSDWLNSTPEVVIKLGDKSISSSTVASEAGTGYFKKVFDGPFVTPSMGEITVKVATTNKTYPAQPAWGAVYWQYFEHLDKITSAATPLKLNKQLFVEKNTDKGPVLDPITENAYLKVGDKIKVRIELRVDRDMEYVHMKDMRASCMEPVNVLSGYKWQGGLGYYESTKDASTNFFFGWLPKGTYVFEYPLFVTHTGNFSNGVTSIQCMYAPEFNAHSEGVRVNVE